MLTAQNLKAVYEPSKSSWLKMIRKLADAVIKIESATVVAFMDVVLSATDDIQQSLEH